MKKKLYLQYLTTFVRIKNISDMSASFKSISWIRPLCPNYKLKKNI